MAWVTWRQHRLQFLIGIGMLVSVAVAALATGLPMHAAYHRDALSACLPPTARSGCDIIVHHFQTEFGNVLRAVRYLVFFPALVGLFVGAPLVAREFELSDQHFEWLGTGFTSGRTRRGGLKRGPSTALATMRRSSPPVSAWTAASTCSTRAGTTP